MRKAITRVLVVTFAFFVNSMSASHAGPLASWNDSKTKTEITAFVEAVTDPSSDKFVAVEERIAVFDNDGTLWTEKPMYTHAYAAFAKMKEQIEADQTLLKREPWKSVAQKDFGYFAQLYATAEYETLASQLFAAPFGGLSSADYTLWAQTFASGFKHPKLGVGMADLTFQPMIELIDYLEENDFTVYIFTADEGAFLRVFSEELYGIPPARVFGTTVREEFVIGSDGPEFVRTYRVDHLNNWDGKPRLIQKVIGRTPIFAAGNSNGDQHMLQYTALNDGLSILIHHTDADREFAYDKHTDKVMPLASKEGWVVVDMATDWSEIWPNPKK